MILVFFFSKSFKYNCVFKLKNLHYKVIENCEQNKKN